MALYIDIRVNERVVASAAVQNVGGPDARGLFGYFGRAHTAPFADRPDLFHDIAIANHDRQQSVWLLVCKIAFAIARKESVGTLLSAPVEVDG